MEEYSLSELGQRKKKHMMSLLGKIKKRVTKEQIYTTKATLRIQTETEGSKEMWKNKAELVGEG